MIFKSLAVFLILSTALSLNAEAPVQPSLILEGLKGEVSLLRPHGEAWPLEKGQRMLPGDKLVLKEGASVWFRYLKRVRLRAEGPASVEVIKIVEPSEDEGDIPTCWLKIQGGWIAVDSRFQFERAMDLNISASAFRLGVPAGIRWMLGEDKKKRPVFALLDGSWLKLAEVQGEKLLALEKQKKKILKQIPKNLRRWLNGAQTLLILARDFDQDSGKWPSPSVLGPILMRELGSAFPRQLTLVDGSGSTFYAHRANHAIKTANDTWLRTLAKEMGARWILAGNLVVRDPDKDNESVAKYQPAVFKARAEARLIESYRDGDILVSDAATTTVARVGRPRKASRHLALEGASEKLAEHLRYHFSRLLQGRSHSQKLLSYTFNNVQADTLARLKRALGRLDAVQRLFSRRFSNGLYKVDLVPRRGAKDLVQAVETLDIPGYRLEPAGKDPAGATVYTLRSR